jgi:hypothetical protein
MQSDGVPFICCGCDRDDGKMLACQLRSPPLAECPCSPPLAECLKADRRVGGWCHRRSCRDLVTVATREHDLEVSSVQRRVAILANKREVLWRELKRESCRRAWSERDALKPKQSLELNGGTANGLAESISDLLGEEEA